jgi:hypothetical protein
MRATQHEETLDSNVVGIEQGLLGGQRLLNTILEFFRSVPDPRTRAASIEYDLHEVLNAAFALFVLRFPSLLKFEEHWMESVVRENIQNVFQVSSVPSDTQMREILDDLVPQALRPLFKQLVGLAVQSKALLPYRFYEGKYLIAMDGTGFFSSDKIHCSSCLVRDQRKGTEQRYQHQMLCGAIVSPDHRTVIPLYPEQIGVDDGSDKNDCERNAMKRFLIQFRQDFPKLEGIILGDALSANIPQVEQIRCAGLSFILNVKPGSQKTLFRSAKGGALRGEMKKHVVVDTIGDKVKKKRTRTYFWINEVLLSHTDQDYTVNFLDFTETIEWVCKGKKTKRQVHFSWITDFYLTENNVETIMRGGRTRWGIENDLFNTIKNRDFHFEHNYGHGYKYLSNLLAVLMVLAFLFDQLQQLGCKLFKKALIAKKRKSYLTEDIRNSFKGNVIYQSWQQLISSLVYPKRYTLQPAPT